MTNANLMETLVGAAETHDYECTDAQVLVFISLAIDNNDLGGEPTTAEVPDAEVEGWIENFKEWLAEYQ